MKYTNLTFRKALFSSSFFISGIFIFGNLIPSAKSSTSVLIILSMCLLIFAVSEIVIFNAIKKNYLKALLPLVIVFISLGGFIIRIFSSSLPLQNNFYAKSLVNTTLVIVLIIICCIAAKAHFGALEGVFNLLFFLFVLFLIGILSAFLNTKSINPLPFTALNKSMISYSKIALVMFGDSCALCSIIYNPQNQLHSVLFDSSEYKKSRFGLYLGSVIAIVFILFISCLYFILFSGNAMQLMSNPHLSVTKIFSLVNVPEIYTFLFCSAVFRSFAEYYK